MRCRYCNVLIYFHFVLYRAVSNDSTYCPSGPGHLHHH